MNCIDKHCKSKKVNGLQKYLELLWSCVHGQSGGRKLLSKIKLMTRAYRRQPVYFAKLLGRYPVDNSVFGGKKSSANQHQSLVPTVKPGGGSIMVWGLLCCPGAGTAGSHWGNNGFNGTKHTSNSPTEWLKRRKESLCFRTAKSESQSHI